MGDYELYHASTRKHKYIKKIGNRYFYTQQEIQAYLKEKQGKAHEFNEAVAEATGRRDVYFEAKQIKKTGGKYNPANYDDDNATLKTGKKSKIGWHDDDGSVITRKGTMQYDNEYTRELNAATRKRGREKIKQMTGINVDKLSKQSERGKKVLGKLSNPVKVGHHTTIKSGDSITETHTDSNGKVTKTTTKKSVGHNTTIKTGGNTTSTDKKKKNKVGHKTTIKTRQIKKKAKNFYKNNINPGVTVTYDEAVLK